jgi:hypothetical protein
MKKDIIEFIEKAKKQGYASTTDTFKKTKDGGKRCVFKSGNLTYTDKYFGNLIDCGQERVYENGKVIWVMAYRGGIIKHEEMHNEAFNFLKKCISKMPKNFPVRGPRQLKIKDWRYENNWEGNIESFTGEENIYYKGEKICFRNYLGGIIKNKK